jgi:hypothetical protein
MEKTMLLKSDKLGNSLSEELFELYFQPVQLSLQIVEVLRGLLIDRFESEFVLTVLIDKSRELIV